NPGFVVTDSPAAAAPRDADAEPPKAAARTSAATQPVARAHCRFISLLSPFAGTTAASRAPCRASAYADSQEGSTPFGRDRLPGRVTRQAGDERLPRRAPRSARSRCACQDSSDAIE